MHVTAAEFMNLCTIDFGHGPVPWLSADATAATPLGTIHLSPANGLPAASYASFIGLLQQRYHVTGMDNRGAWPGIGEPPADWTWEDHADDLIAAIESQHSQPVIGMGHSIGGTITVLAAEKRPDLFSKLVIIDAASAPSRIKSSLLQLIPQWLSFKLFKFIRGSHHRRRLWPTPEAFYQHYKNHPTYRQFTDQAMLDYTHHGLRKRADGQYELVFNPSWESYNFRRVYFLWRALRAVKVPSLVLRAEHTYMYSSARFAELNKNLPTHIASATIVGAQHLVTHEQPRELYQQVDAWLS